MLALLALAFVLAAVLARRMVPEPYATAGAGLVGLSPPALAAATTITPGVPAAVLLSGAALCALAIRERPRLRFVFGGALMLAALPWLGWTFIVPGAVVAWALVVWTLRERRRLAAFVAGEALAASLVFYATINDRFYGGLTPRAAGSTELPELPLGYIERLPRLAGLWLDRDDGLLRWAPLLALVFFSGWLLYRSRRDQLARVALARREAEVCAGLLLGVIGAQLLVVALFSASGLRGPAFPGVAARRRAAGRRRADGVGPAPHPAAAGGPAGPVLARRQRVADPGRAQRQPRRLAGGRHVAAVGPAGQRLPELHRRGDLACRPVRAARRGRARARDPRAPRGGRVAPRRRGLADVKSDALTRPRGSSRCAPTSPRARRSCRSACRRS